MFKGQTQTLTEVTARDQITTTVDQTIMSPGKAFLLIS